MPPGDRPATGVHRDRWGVPHLRADTVDELARWQGRVAATDRAWQLEVERWRAEGRLAAHLGPAALRLGPVRPPGPPRRHRPALLRPARPRPPGRWVTAYVDGVNDGPRRPARRRPPSSPPPAARPAGGEPWTPLGVFLVQHILFATFPHKLWHAHVAATLGPAAPRPVRRRGARRLRQQRLGAARRPGDRPGAGHRRRPAPAARTARHLPADPAWPAPSSTWSDWPSPGCPGSPHFGHAGDGRLGGHQRDGRLPGPLPRTAAPRRRPGAGPRRPTAGCRRTGTSRRIEVRGGEPETVEVIETAARPGDRPRPAHRRGAQPADPGPGRGAPRSSTRCCRCCAPARADDVADALRDWVEPVNSVLVADRHGAVHQLVAGLVPLRDDGCRREPVPGWDPRTGGAAATPPPSRTRSASRRSAPTTGVTTSPTSASTSPRRTGPTGSATCSPTASPRRTSYTGHPVGVGGLRGLLDRLDPGPLSGPAAAAAGPADRLGRPDGRRQRRRRGVRRLAGRAGPAPVGAPRPGPVARPRRLRPALRPVDRPAGPDRARRGGGGRRAAPPRRCGRTARRRRAGGGRGRRPTRPLGTAASAAPAAPRRVRGGHGPGGRDARRHRPRRRHQLRAVHLQRARGLRRVLARAGRPLRVGPDRPVGEPLDRPLRRLGPPRRPALRRPAATVGHR